jgi:hypothetical protein
MGVLGVMPLSGIATPFLSYGKTSMVCNLALVGVLLSISSSTGETTARDPLPRSMKGLKIALVSWRSPFSGARCSCRFIAADPIAVRASLVQQADGTVRYQYNYRLLQIARRVPRGTIFDRNGLALATGDAAIADQALQRLKAVGVTDAGFGCVSASDRCYPLGALAFHVLGESLNRTNWSAPNSSLSSAIRTRSFRVTTTIPIRWWSRSLTAGRKRLSRVTIARCCRSSVRRATRLTARFVNSWRAGATSRSRSTDRCRGWSRRHWKHAFGP